LARKRQNSSMAIPHGRKRTVSPGFFLDPTLLGRPPIERLFFEGLWCFADEAGRLLDKPIDLKIRIVPMDALDPDAVLETFARLGLLARYQAGGLRFLAMKPGPWKEIQRIHPDEPKSAIPPPPAGAFRIPVIGDAAVDPISVYGNRPPGVSVRENPATDPMPVRDYTAADPISGPGSSGLRDPRAVVPAGSADLWPDPIPGTETAPVPTPPKADRASNEWLDWYRIYQRKRRERLAELGAEPVDEDFNIGRACATTSKWWAHFKELPTTDTSDKCCDLMLALFDAYLADDWGAGATPAMYPFAAFAKDDYWQRLARGLVYE